MTTTKNQLAALTNAVQELAHVFADSWTARQVGQAMTCIEANALAYVIREVDPIAAGAFLRGHANGEDQGDEPSDLHYHLRDDFHADQPHIFAGDDDDECMGCFQPDVADIHIAP
jgi:hypothetical protein